MGQPVELQANYAGMDQDSPRDQLPAGAVWSMVDWVPQRIAAPLQKRGGWGWASPTLDGSSPAYLLGLCRTPDYGAGAFNVGITDDGELYTFTNSGMTDEGAAVVVAQNPFVHRAGEAWVVVIPAADGSTGPLQWTDTGAEPEPLSDTAPGAKFGAVWNDRTLLANGTVDSTVYPGRLWFGPVGDATGVWDADSWWDFNLPVVAVGVTRNAILCFHARTVSRLRGSTPPRTPESADDTNAVGDLVEDQPFAGESAVGCIDARSLTHWGEWLVWADFTGVYMTDGISLQSLTAKGGMSSYWKGLLPNFTGAWTISAGVERDVLMVSLVDEDQAPVAFLCYDLLRNIWYRFGGNVDATCFMHIPGATADKTYAGRASEPRVMNLETVLLGQNAKDADGAAIEPVLETGFFRGFTRLHRRWLPSLALQQWLRVFFNYQMDPVDGSDPYMTVSYATDALDPNNTTYTPLSRVLEASTLTSRVRIPLRFRSRGVAFKLQQFGASLDTMLRGIEAEFYPLEDGRVDNPGLTAPPPVPPDPPVLLSATASAGQIDLVWVAPEDDGGAAVSGYSVYRGTVTGGETLLVVLGVVLAYTDTDVDPETEYFYKVTASNPAGESVLSNEESATTPAAPNVLKSDAGAADAWAEIDLGSDQAETWTTFEQFFTADVLAFWTSEFSGFLAALLAADDTTDLGGVYISDGQWIAYNVAAVVSPVPVASVWVTVEHHRIANTSVGIYINGALAGTGVDADSTATRFARFGQYEATANADEITYCKNLKVGTTRGDDDLFSWPDTETDLSAFTSTSGDVSVVEDPA